CVYSVNCIRSNVYCALESESHLRSPEIIVNCLRKSNNIQSFFPKHIGCFVGSVSSKYHKAVQIQLVICMLNRFHLVQTVLVRNTHQLERLSGCSENRSASCENSGKIF